MPSSFREDNPTKTTALQLQDFYIFCFQLVVLVQYLRHRLQALVVRRLKAPSRPLSQVDEVQICYGLVTVAINLRMCHLANVPLSFHCFETPSVLHAIQSQSSDQNVPLSFHCFETPTVLPAIQSQSSDQNVPLSFHCFETPTVLPAIQSQSSDQNVSLLFIVLKHPLFSQASSHNLVIKMFHRLFWHIFLKTSLFSMPSNQ